MISTHTKPQEQQDAGRMIEAMETLDRARAALMGAEPANRLRAMQAVAQLRRSLVAPNAEED